MPKYVVTFRGEDFDIAVSGNSSEEILREYQEIKSGLDKALGRGGSTKSERARTPQILKDETTSADEVHISLDALEIPDQIMQNFVSKRKSLSNWDALVLLLSHASGGLTNTQLRSLSEELGLVISSEWFDTHFHRRANAGLVISRHTKGRKGVTYFLAEPGKLKAKKLLEELSKSSD